MKFLVLNLFIFLFFSGSILAQSDSSELKTVDFFSPKVVGGKITVFDRNRSCFSFITETASCDANSDISYGNLRISTEWDWFQTSGVGSRNKIESLGKKTWADNVKIPVVNPYPKLKNGESRSVVIDASGRDGRDGANGRNGDGSSNENPNVYKDLTRQTPIQREERTSDYNPFERAVVGKMYVMRVVDENNDFYVLFRVDEIEKGKRCKISWKKVKSPEKG